MNESPFKAYFSSVLWDISYAYDASHATCLHCKKIVSAATNTNVRSHLTAKHPKFLIKELAADETLDTRNVSTLRSLIKEDYGVVEKYKDAAKKSLDD